MVNRPALSKGEMEIARALWSVGPATVRQVFESLPKNHMDFATVQTYLRRLDTKGYANSKLQGRVRVYSARVQAKKVIRDTVNDLIQRLFAGETMPLVRHLIEDHGIEENEIAELRHLIDELERGSR